MTDDVVVVGRLDLGDRPGFPAGLRLAMPSPFVLRLLGSAPLISAYEICAGQGVESGRSGKNEMLPDIP